MLKIYIGYDFEDNPTSVLLARNKKSADIAWAGMNNMPHHIEEIDPSDKSIGIHGTVFLLTSKERRLTSYGASLEDYYYREFKRGL